MKFFVTTILILSGFLSFSQVSDSLGVNKAYNQGLITDTKKMKLTSTFDLNDNFKNYQFNLKSFSVYNQTSGLNDVYLSNKDNSHYFSKSVLLQENEFREYKKDSFNSMGLSTTTPDIVVGIICVFLKKNTRIINLKCTVIHQRYI